MMNSIMWDMFEGENDWHIVKLHQAEDGNDPAMIIISL